MQVTRVKRLEEQNVQLQSLLGSGGETAKVAPARSDMTDTGQKVSRPCRGSLSDRAGSMNEDGKEFASSRPGGSKKPQVKDAMAQDSSTQRADAASPVLKA